LRRWVQRRRLSECWERRLNHMDGWCIASGGVIIVKNRRFENHLTIS
jgi:hypothetical protein